MLWHHRSAFPRHEVPFKVVSAPAGSMQHCLVSLLRCLCVTQTQKTKIGEYNETDKWIEKKINVYNKS
jgi:hypothetical protein